MKRIVRKPAINEVKQHQKEYSSLFILPIILTIIGLFFIFEASSVTAFRNVGDSFYYVKAQLLWFVLGIASMVFFSKFDYKNLYFLSLPLMIINTLLLIAVLIPGIGSKVYGARRWIDLGFASLQPTEFIKFSLILYLSSWLVKKEKGIFLFYFGLAGFIIALIMLQPDMGTAIIVFGIFATIYLLSGHSIKPLLGLIPVAALGFIGLVSTSPYRMKRFLAFMDPNLDPLGITYHVKQIIISLSSGGIIGRGFSESRQRYQFLPEAHTDSIFAIVGEEIGFIGGVILISALFYLMYRMYKISKSTPDMFGQILSGGIFSLISLQIIINLGAMVGLIPLTGVPLPFISYGGSSLLVFFSLMGILLNIAKRRH
jgi:cell division protein FtsW